MDSINSRIAEELGVRPQQVEAAVGLLDEGSTVPFIASFRKEVTGSLDDTQLRHLEERLRYLRELDERRAIGGRVEVAPGEKSANNAHGTRCNGYAIMRSDLRGVIDDQHA